MQWLKVSVAGSLVAGFVGAVWFPGSAVLFGSGPDNWTMLDSIAKAIGATGAILGVGIPIILWIVKARRKSHERT